MFSKKNKDIINDTNRIARGTFLLSIMKDEIFVSTYKQKEELKMQNPAEYHLPDWFTIKFIKDKNNTHQFVGSFTDGNGYPIVYKKEFLKVLKKLRVKIEQLDSDTYKIIRKSHE